MKLKLHSFDLPLKRFLTAYIVVLSIGVSLGLSFLNHTTKMTPAGAVEHFNGSNENSTDLEFSETYAKSVSELLMTTHNHLIGFSFIFLTIGLIFYFNSIVVGFWKSFLMIEPLVSVFLSFGSLWGVRFINDKFIYITVVSAILMYISYFVMVTVSLYELIFKKPG